MGQLEIFTLGLGRFEPNGFSFSVIVVQIWFQVGFFWLLFVIFLASYLIHRRRRCCHEVPRREETQTMDLIGGAERLV